MTPRDLYIVAADRQDLYEILRKQFARNENVDVILDRRRGARRAAPGGAKADKRKSGRRLDEERRLLRTLGVILVSARHRTAAGTKKPASRRGKGA